MLGVQASEPVHGDDTTHSQTEQQWQCNLLPSHRMRGQPSQADPVVTIEPLTIGGAGRPDCEVHDCSNVDAVTTANVRWESHPSQAEYDRLPAEPTSSQSGQAQQRPHAKQTSQCS